MNKLTATVPNFIFVPFGCFYVLEEQKPTEFLSSKVYPLTTLTQTPKKLIREAFQRHQTDFTLFLSGMSKPPQGKPETPIDNSKAFFSFPVHHSWQKESIIKELTQTISLQSRLVWNHCRNM